MPTTQVKLSDEEPSITLDIPPGMTDREVILDFFGHIYKGYATVLVLKNTFTMEHEKEIPDHVLAERIATYPHIHNPRRIILP